jgi:hypothetical protein
MAAKTFFRLKINFLSQSTVQYSTVQYGSASIDVKTDSPDSADSDTTWLLIHWHIGL